MPCNGNGSDHCCWVNGKPCPLLIENHVDETGYLRRWACSLRAELGNWVAVITDPRYAPIKKHFSQFGYDCSSWPGNGRKCGQCGAE